MNSSHTDQLSAAMRGSRNFRHGGGGGGGGGVHINLTKKKITLTALFVCFLLFSCSSAYFTEVKRLISKRNIIFQGSGGGPNFSRGGGVRTPCPLPSGSALRCDLSSFPVRKMMRSPLGLHMCSFSCNFVVCF